ncbi:ribonuclease III [Nostoc sp. 'Peltigera membranacea cyanobiont' 213]|uniref:ribonuclease III n=1 Tax=Nostoc sp. 'Peltigera membranacea cyanobiont' 213 TaxID=2014530 RepID=UPI000B953425|nr:ribonuclease III [Nostoc sp. 'Peltigera membranacea cyanobiont' 213]OYD94196.1 ribonuclease III [Nostoc sp. 'Peltigera membranacea cyanobiont' 213]
MYELPKFDNSTLRDQALTHRSYVNEHPTSKHNERLEFLGDALLNFLSGEYLYKKHREKGEDELTRRRSALVDEKQLAKFAEDLELNSKMRLGNGAIRDGGRQNPNLLSSTFEAIIGAYYEDKEFDIKPVRDFVKQFFDSVPENNVVSRSNIDSKNRFQEWVQSRGITTPPKYNTRQIGGESHTPEFLATVFMGEEEFGEGKGRNKKDAEKAAAEDALANLEKQGLL